MFKGKWSLDSVLRMNKDKIIKNLRDNPDFQAIIDWHVKFDFLDDQINILKQLKEFPIFLVSAFILKSQFVEFKLKQFISSIDSHLNFSNTSEIIRRKTKTPKDFDNMEVTLGGLRNILNQYKSSHLNNLQNNLTQFIKIRNLFAHKLFNIGNIDQLIAEAENGLKLASKIEKNIKSVENLLEKH